MPTLPPPFLLPLVFCLPPALPAALLDRLMPGDSPAHTLTMEHAEIVKGGLGQTAWQLQPTEPGAWEGGALNFRLKVDPKAQNYFTVKLWGGEANQQKHVLLVDGKQIGYRHLGDTEILDLGSDEPAYAGRFFYRTSPLPINLTQGKTEISCQVKLNGRIWSYGADFGEYQKPVSGPGRELHAFYTHTNGWFQPPADEIQGTAPPVSPMPPAPEEDILKQVRDRVSGDLQRVLRDRRPAGQMHIHFLGRAWHVPWTPAFQNPKAIDRVVASVDELYRRHTADPDLVKKGDPAVYNKDWFIYGLAAEGVRLLAEPLKSRLEEEIDNGQGVRQKRGPAWGQMFAAGRDQLRANRRQYTNQSMIVDMNIYRQNSAVTVTAPSLALPEPAMRRYLYEAVGLEPWLGSETPDGPAKPLGEDFYQLTRKGLTRELGYVGGYGEVLDWVAHIYESTRPPGGSGDARLRAHMEKMSRARSWFRYPLTDPAGHQAMRLETVIGWRDVHFPGEITYGSRNSWDAISLCPINVSDDPWTMGFAQQSLADGQFFPDLAEHLKGGGLRITVGLLDAPELIEKVKTAPPSPQRLPMTPGQPDFAWADEENGVVAIKHGEEILYVSLYWRARHAVNSLAQIHHMAPGFSRIATVKTDVIFADSGQKWKRPDWTNFGFASGGPRYPVKFQSAHAGEELPIAAGQHAPDWKPGKESLHAGRAQLYQLRYGPWFIAVNATPDKSFPIPAPQGITGPAMDLVSGKPVVFAKPLTLPPLSTLVLRFP